VVRKIGKRIIRPGLPTLRKIQVLPYFEIVLEIPAPDDLAIIFEPFLFSGKGHLTDIQGPERELPSELIDRRHAPVVGDQIEEGPCSPSGVICIAQRKTGMILS